MIRILNWFFGCAHSRQTWPLTRRGRTYTACLECGQEFEYAGVLIPKSPELASPKGELQAEVVR